MHDSASVLIVGALLAAALGASLIAGRLRLPGLVLFLGLGMLIGSDGLGWIDFDDFAFAESVGVIALALILFEGGLAAGWGEIRPVLRPALSLALVGTLITAVVTGFAASWLFGFTTIEGLLLGSIVASTDGAAVFSLLRGTGPEAAARAHARGRGGHERPDRGAARARLHRVGAAPRLRASPTCCCCSPSSSGSASSPASPSAGCRAGRSSRCSSPRPASTRSRRSPRRRSSFGSAAALHGSGFLAVYLTGLALGTGNLPAKRTVTAFHEGLAWVAQLGMFLTLGLLVFPSELRRGRREGDAARAARRLRQPAARDR